MIKINKFKSIPNFTEKSAEFIINKANEFIKSYDRVTLVLSGGNTPKLLYNRLSNDYLKDKLDWKKVHIFFGDDRYVPLDNPQNNYYTAWENLLSKIDIPEQNIHKINTNLKTPEEAAFQYENDIKVFFDNNKPSFDITLLGIGTDGHTASLFPECKSDLKIKNKIAINTVSKNINPKGHRISLTLEVINNSKNIIFLVTGENKKNILDKILNDREAVNIYPAAMINPAANLYWFISE